MGTFKDKSEQTLSSAELLLNNSHYNSCVHCFYYSCFQLVLDLLRGEFCYKDEQIDAGTKNSLSHNVIINELKKSLEKSNIDYQFLSDFGKLKKMRIKADYSDKCIPEKEAKKMQQRAKEFHKEIEKIYQNGI